MRIANDSSSVTQWWKDCIGEGRSFPVWAANGIDTLAKPEKGTLVCINPDALKGGTRARFGPPLWKYQPADKSRKAICIDRRVYFTTEREAWVAYYTELQLQQKKAEEKIRTVEREIESTLAQLVLQQATEIAKRGEK